MINIQRAAWIEQLIDGEDEATEYFYREYFPRLVALARSVLKRRYGFANDQEDVAMSAICSFLQRVDSFPKLNDGDDLWKLLMTITLRKAFRSNHKRERESTGRSQDWSTTLQARGPSPEEAAIAIDEADRLMVALPDEMTRRIVMRRFEGLTQQEIADKQNVSLSTVERKLRLARAILSDFLETDDA